MDGSQWQFVPVFSVLHDEKKVASVIEAYHRAAEKALGQSIPAVAREKAGEGLALFLVVTGGTENLLLEVAGQRDEPVILLAHPEQNSLPASLEILARLRQLGRAGQVIYFSSPDDKDAQNRLSQVASAALAYRRMHAARLGLIGRPSDWLAASTPDPALVTKVWGPTVVPISMDEVLEEMQAAANDPQARLQVGEMRQEFLGRAVRVVEPTEPDVDKAVTVYLALRRVVERHQLDALSIRCFDLVIRARTSGCYALSRLLDEDLVAGCEGDLPATLTMMLLSYMSGQPSFLANPARVDTAANSILLAHCTIARRLVEKYTVRSHFESGLGVGISGELRKAPVTVARIGGSDLRQVFVGRGEIVATGAQENLCRTQVTIKMDEPVEYFLKRPLGNHHVITYGDYREAVRAYQEMLPAT